MSNRNSHSHTPSGTVESNEQAALLEQIHALRDLVEGDSGGLGDCVDAALLLTRFLNVGGSPAAEEPCDQQEILQTVSSLMRMVEQSIQDSEKCTDQRRLIKDLLLGEILVQLGAVSQSQVDGALKLQRTTGSLIGTNLIKTGAATADQIEEGMRVQNQLRQASGVSGDLFGAIVPNHVLWEHAVLRRCRYQELTAQDVKILAVQMYKFCNEFSSILAATFVRCPDDFPRMIIADNLFDETGNGDERNAHPELFRRFTRALNISDEQLNEIRIEPETQSLIDTYLALPDRYGYLASLGAICYASENIIASLYTQILHGIENEVSVCDEDLVFFKAHVELDVEHANALMKVVNSGVTTVDEASQVVFAIKEALAARVRFFDGIERCIRRASKSGNRATDTNL